MKSSQSELQRRGMTTTEESISVSGASKEELIVILHSQNASLRTAAAIQLAFNVDEVAEELLKQLVIEKSLYTKIAICETLETGDKETAIKMLKYLGVIGNNQHKKLPMKVSAKKSFPLPRDIIARTLGKMDISIFPELLTVLETKNEDKISEVLDAIGFMAFYSLELGNEENAKKIINIIRGFVRNELIVWKALLCLSAFPVAESIEILKEFEVREDLLGNEAKRSLTLIGVKADG